MATSYNFSQQSQYSQPQFFPQSQGSVYFINNSFEIANIPISSGLSVAICMPEETMYVKTLENGNPVVIAYKLSNYNLSPAQNQKDQKSNIESVLSDIQNKLGVLEKQVNSLKGGSGGKINEQLV